MKKLLISLFAALFLSGAFAMSHTFPDIPENHWAGDAVMEIADLGIVIGFPDGTFRGNESFTRYQAALVISRMLDVVAENMDAAMAMAEEDMAALRAAVQELASDVASQGVRLSATESAVASLSDDVTANDARIADLEAAAMDSSDEMVREVQNQIASLRMAVDTAQAQAEAAAAAADDASNAAARAAASADDNAASIEALTAAVRVLNNSVTELQSRECTCEGVGGMGVPAGLNDRVARNGNDIANIREFVILLRRDQVAMGDRVSALEDAVSGIDDLEARVAALEDNPFGISGEISIDYNVVRTNGSSDPFDVDRVFGYSLPRGNASYFTAGEATTDEDDNENSPEYEDDVMSDLTVNGSFSVDWSKTFDGTGPLGMANFDAVVEFSLTTFTGVPGEFGPGGDSEHLGLDIDEVRVNYQPIGMAPLTFEYGMELGEKFTGYVLFTEDMAHDEGFVVSVGAPDFLAAFDPTLTGVYAVDGTTDNLIMGVRGTLSPLDGLTGGVSLAKLTTNTGEHADLAGDNSTTMVWGVDGSATISVLSLNGEYASSSTDGTGNGSILFVEAGIDVGSLGIPVLESLEANYRDIDVDWFTNTDGLTADGDEDAEFVEDQAGFGVSAGFNLFGLASFDAYYDSYSVDAGDSASAFGVDADAGLPLGFMLEGFYHSASINGTTVDDLSTGVDASEAVVVAGMDRNDDYDTGFGVSLSHDGSSDSALIDNLNLSFSYSQTEADFSKTTIAADADYTLGVSIVEITPYVGYESVNDADGGTDDTVTLEAGTGLAATVGSLPLVGETSLGANVNYRNTDHSDADTYTSSVLQYSVGVEFGGFLFGPMSNLSVDYGSFTGTNINANPGDISDANTGGVTSSVTGYEAVWNYYGLEFAYGVFVNDDDTSATGDEDVAQQFSISYTVTF